MRSWLSCLAVAWHPFLLAGCAVVATGGTSDGKVLIYKVCEDLPVLSATINDVHPIAIAWSWEGLLASSTSQSDILIHRYSGHGDPELLYRMRGHRGKVWGLSWSPLEPSKFASAASDNTVRVWSLEHSILDHRNYTVYRVNQSCRYLRWLDSVPSRLGCGRDSSVPGGPAAPFEDPPYTYYVEFNLMGQMYSKSLLESLTYGKLSESDVAELGYNDIMSTALGTRP